jgi:endonuclease-8
MPEGDTVFRAAARLRDALAGEVVVRSEFRVPRFATADLAGRTVTEVVPRGKHLLTRFSGDLTLHTHLRMDGSWLVHRAAGHQHLWRHQPGTDSGLRVLLATATQLAAGHRLPVVELLPTTQEDRVVGHLGPDLLGPDWDERAVLDALLADPGRQIGAALLDQRILAGLGNIWRTEACFVAGVGPGTPVGAVADLAGLVRGARRMILLAARTGRQVTTGSTRRGEERWIHGRAGRPCRRCGTPVRAVWQPPDRPRASATPPDGTAARPPDGTAAATLPTAFAATDRQAVGGVRDEALEARITAWCPHCQPGPAPSGPPVNPRAGGGPARSAGRGRR